MPTNEKPDAHQKALSINLDGTIFGSFAEIGAGQEVARWFMRVGGASGIRKSVYWNFPPPPDNRVLTGTDEFW